VSPVTGRTRIFDADLHHHWSWEDLAAYLPEGTRPPVHAGAAFPKITGSFRTDATPPGGGLPASDPAFVVEHHLDRYGIDYALLTCGSTLPLPDVPDVDFACAIARATNDFTIDRWLAVDERFLAAAVICPNDPDQAADEIRRAAANSRVVAVFTTAPPTLLGHPFMHPVLAACAETGLPLQFHPGAQNYRGGRSLGAPSSAAELRSTLGLPGIQHLASLVFEGAFVKFPALRYVSNEWGTAWIPFVLWRLDMEYREHREEVPWLTRLPSEYVREHVRFTTQPVEDAERAADYMTLMGLVRGPELLIYSSDYPHHDFDNPEVMVRLFPADWREAVFFENARRWYRLDERLAAQPPEPARAAAR
jgi:predicted TIM-barrel fold metal-dependent hydrolase